MLVGEMKPLSSKFVMPWMASEQYAQERVIPFKRYLATMLLIAVANIMVAAWISARPGWDPPWRPVATHKAESGGLARRSHHQQQTDGGQQSSPGGSGTERHPPRKTWSKFSEPKCLMKKQRDQKSEVSDPVDDEAYLPALPPNPW